MRSEKKSTLMRWANLHSQQQWILQFITTLQSMYSGGQDDDVDSPGKPPEHGGQEGGVAGVLEDTEVHGEDHTQNFCLLDDQ